MEPIVGTSGKDGDPGGNVGPSSASLIAGDGENGGDGQDVVDPQVGLTIAGSLTYEVRGGAGGAGGRGGNNQSHGPGSNGGDGGDGGDASGHLSDLHAANASAITVTVIGGLAGAAGSSGAHVFPGPGMVGDGGSAGDAAALFDNSTFTATSITVTAITSGGASGVSPEGAAYSGAGGNSGRATAAFENNHVSAGLSSSSFSVIAQGNSGAKGSSDGSNGDSTASFIGNSITAGGFVSILLYANGQPRVAGLASPQPAAHVEFTGNTVTFSGGNDTLSINLLAQSNNSTANASITMTGNVFIGGGGNDALNFTVESGLIAFDMLENTVTGFEEIRAQGETNTLKGDNLANSFLGSTGADTLWGRGGDDVLRGGGGADTLDGGDGEDTAVFTGMWSQYAFGKLANGAITVTDTRAGSPDGLDTLTHVEFLRFSDQTVRAGIQVGVGGVVIQGTAGDDVIAGSKTVVGQPMATANPDVIFGYGGKDALDGGAGADSLYGGDGDDTYTVDNLYDEITEAAGEGTDTVKSSVSFTLGANIENLSFKDGAAVDGTGNDLANKITGNASVNVLTGAGGADQLKGLAGNDVLWGGAGADKLDGGTGADEMHGGADNDSYTVDDLGDTVLEDADGGKDTVTSTVTFTLGANVENLTLKDGAADGTGNELANTIKGNAGENVLTGGLGKDSLTGGAGADTFVFGAALATSTDKISDFEHGIDHLAFHAGDYGLTAGALDPANLVLGPAATHAHAEFVYDAAKKTLYWDADGFGGAAAVAVATFSTAVTLTASDFVILA